MRPLSRISVTRSYDKDTTKTETERMMPIHPVLDALITAWKPEWVTMMGRPYTTEDLVVPCPTPANRGPRKPLGAMRDRHYVWKRAQKDLFTLGLRPRRVHDLRRTGLSPAQEDGADENMLKRGTHAPPKHVVGLYTSVAWEALCREVAKLKLTPREKLSEDAMPMVAYRRLKPRTLTDSQKEQVLAEQAALLERIRRATWGERLGPTGTNPGNNEALGIPRASSGGAGNRNLLSVNSQPRDGARLSAETRSLAVG